ncbi:MAG: hypothetical protein IPG39_13355 [Bacteroidetes bacterium]|nr:hypothetical protein [Bacteroidota bacterium]
MWWDLVSAPKYEVPKGSGINRLLAGSLWLGGIDGSGQIMTAAQMFRQTPGNNNATDFSQGLVIHVLLLIACNMTVSGK